MTTDTIHTAPDKLGYVAGIIERGLVLNLAGESRQPLTGALADLDEQPARHGFAPRTAMTSCYVNWFYAYGKRPKRGPDWRVFRDSFHRALRGQVPS